MPIKKIIPNARALRFVRGHSRYMNSNGTIKKDPEYVKRSPEASADFYASVLERYQKVQAEDASNPEVWIVYSPEEIAFGPPDSEVRKKYRVEDGQFRPEYLETLDPYLMNYEMKLQQQFYRDYENIKRCSKLAESEWGYNYSEQEYEKRWGEAAVIVSREQLLKDIRNGEDIDSLPYDVDLDDYLRINRQI
ncbi:MAG: hypothetical protein AAFX80_10560 [Cyanobacteria bacterium J06639_18]